ncbi:MAG: HEAT repeat domain-containing protein [Candidatus Sumerlaeaceae bacterium]
MATLEHLWIALEEGRIAQALAIAEDLLVRSPHAASNQAQAAGQLTKLYRDQWRVWPAVRFEEEIVPALGPAGDTVLDPLRHDLDLFHEWRERLARIAHERLTDEFRGAVKANELKRAFALARSLIDTAFTPDERVQRARQIGNLLGGLVAEKERAASFVRQLARSASELGLDGQAAVAMLEEYERSGAAAYRRETAPASAMRVEHTQAVVELARFLPDRMALHEPNEDELERFLRAIRAIVAVCLTSPRWERYYEATALFVEFVPKELSTTSALAGVEQRLYASLGRTARIVATKTFAQVGAASPVWESYVRFVTEAIWNKKIAAAIVETIGLFRNPAGVRWLAKWIEEPQLDVRAEALAALGSIGTQEAIDVLLKVLQSCLREKVLTGPPRRDAIAVLHALGRAARTLDGAQRSQLMKRVVKMLPPGDHELAMRTALAFLQGPLDKLDPELLTWAATIATQALWHVDRPELARQGRTAPLGFRQPLIELLERVAPHALATINSVALHHAKTFSGAYLALAELYAKLADPATLPVLRQLITNTFLHDDKPKTPYQRETILEPGTEERSEITRDKVLSALVYAVSKIPSEEADELLAELFEEVRSGRLPRPGKETADVLMQAYMKVGQKRGGEGMFGVFPGAAAETQEGQAEISTATVLSHEETQWLHDLEARFLLATKRRARRVAAMAGLAKKKTVAALPKIVEHVIDKDAIVAAAAATALMDFARAPVTPAVLERLHAELLHALQLGTPVMRQKVVDVLRRLGPRRSPLKERLEQLLATGALDGAARVLVEKLLAPPPDAKPVGGEGGAANDKPDGAAGSPAGVAASSGPKHLTELEKRRQYLLARQAWIRGGKKGPEPQPPE